MRRLLAALVLLASTLIGGTSLASAQTAVTVTLAGDIACQPPARPRPGHCQDQAVAAAMASSDLQVALGDTQYDKGELANYNKVFARSWGKLPHLMPVPGNHEYKTPNAAGYFAYFGQSHATFPWHVDVGEGWQVIGADADCAKAGVDCARQGREIAALVAANPCSVVAWHQPRWASGDHKSTTSVSKLWDPVVANGGALVINGHNHSYERTKPFGKTVEITAGTGGANLDVSHPAASFDAKVIYGKFGFERLTLTVGHYRAEFVTLAGKALDPIEGSCAAAA